MYPYGGEGSGLASGKGLGLGLGLGNMYPARNDSLSLYTISTSGMQLLACKSSFVHGRVLCPYILAAACL